MTFELLYLKSVGYTYFGDGMEGPALNIVVNIFFPVFFWPKKKKEEDLSEHTTYFLQLEQIAPPQYPITLPPVASFRTPGASPNLITCDFSAVDYSDWLERMGLLGDSLVPSDIMIYVDLYHDHNPFLDLQSHCLMPFERDYIL